MYTIEGDAFKANVRWIVTRAGRYKMPEGKPGELIRYRIEDDGSVTFGVAKQQKETRR